MAASTIGNCSLNKVESFVLDHSIYSLHCIEDTLYSLLEVKEAIDQQSLIKFQTLRSNVFTHVIENDWNLSLCTLGELNRLIEEFQVDKYFEEDPTAPPSEVVAVLIGLVAAISAGESIFHQELPKGGEEERHQLRVWVGLLKERGELWMKFPTYSSRPLTRSCSVSRTSGASQIIKRRSSNASASIAGGVTPDAQVNFMSQAVAGRNKALVAANVKIRQQEVELAQLRAVSKAMRSFSEKSNQATKDALQAEIDAAVPQIKSAGPIGRLSDSISFKETDSDNDVENFTGMVAKWWAANNDTVIQSAQYFDLPIPST
ncbi:hypothetical protein BS50DRAFT_651171 [Corynespora cassiicola Philippines]|uniref:Uncharacterized protein n=1 Tax=Corynespora cassiicola Philippines TaxID=1448308 RepID=A0A2T2N8R3_CORCC|nr:hypothetical protein BS50DRAFT_651171 [Corynespora cassiicola Philippines]